MLEITDLVESIKREIVCLIIIMILCVFLITGIFTLVITTKLNYLEHKIELTLDESNNLKDEIRILKENR